MVAPLPGDTPWPVCQAHRDTPAVAAKKLLDVIELTIDITIAKALTVVEERRTTRCGRACTRSRSTGSR